MEPYISIKLGEGGKREGEREKGGDGVKNKGMGEGGMENGKGRWWKRERRMGKGEGERKKGEVRKEKGEGRRRYCNFYCRFLKRKFYKID